MIGIEISFWAALFVIWYAYIGYPAVLWLVSRIGGHRECAIRDEGPELPAVTMVVSAYNEERVIGAKIENALSLDYPRDLLEIVVVSDGSTDRTREIVLGFAGQGVVLRHYEGRIGKTACLNRAVPLAAGRIIVFSDANSVYERGSLRALLQPFRDASVGFVTGWTRYGAGEAMSAVDSIGMYSRLELITKELEGRLASCIGADGAIFGIRKELYVPLKDYDINDFVIPLTIIERGRRGVLQRGAICLERDAGGTRGEFQRQVRITTRTIRAIVNHRQLLNPLRFGWVAFELFSHKVCRFVAPFCLAGLLIANLVLASLGGLFPVALAIQGTFYLAAAAAGIVAKGGTLSRVSETARTFVVVNVAIAYAWVKYVEGETYTTWFPTQR